jgi:hypothetical protein
VQNRGNAAIDARINKTASNPEIRRFAANASGLARLAGLGGLDELARIKDQG